MRPTIVSHNPVPSSWIRPIPRTIINTIFRHSIYKNLCIFLICRLPSFLCHIRLFHRSSSQPKRLGVLLLPSLHPPKVGFTIGAMRSKHNAGLTAMVLSVRIPVPYRDNGTVRPESRYSELCRF